MKTNDLLKECYERFVTPEGKEQVERTCKMMDDCEEIINNEYADVEIHKPSFNEGFKTGITYFVNSGIDAPNIPIYIVRRYNFMIGMGVIHFVSISKAKAIIYYQEQDHSSYDVHWIIEEWIGEKCKILKIENYGNIEGDVVKVKEIYEKSIHYANSEYESYATEDFIQPIELTEEVLLKIGFKKNIIYGSVIEYFPIDDNLARIFCTKEKQNFKIQIVRKNITETIVKYIKYLHELQNAYYCLTGEELEVEL